MIAARLAGGNLFFGFLGWGFFGALGAARSTRIFLRGFLGGDFWSTRSSSEHSDFLRGIFLGGILFLGGGGVGFGLKVLEKIKK